MIIPECPAIEMELVKRLFTVKESGFDYIEISIDESHERAIIFCGYLGIHVIQPAEKSTSKLF